MTNRDRENEQDTVDDPKVMNREDVSGYEGITLNEKGEEENRTEDGSIHVHVFSKDTWHRLPWYKKILYAVCAAAAVVVLLTVLWFFVVWAAVIAAAAVVVYLLRRLLGYR